MLGDGLDILCVEEGVLGRGKFVVRRRVSVLGEFAAEEPGMDEAGPERTGPNMGSGRTF